MAYDIGSAHASSDYRKVSYMVGKQQIFAQRIPVTKSKLQVIRLILKETQSTRPYSHIQVRTAKGNAFNVFAPVSLLKLICLYRKF